MSARGIIRSFINGMDVGVGFQSPGGRGSDEGRPLLQNGELNLGNSMLVPPRVGITNIKPGYGEEIRILDLRADSKLAEWATVSFSILPVTGGDQFNSAALDVGPLVGIVEFGNGSAFNRVEIDIQQGNFLSTLVGGGGDLVNAFTLPPGGSMVSVPSSSMRVFARNDGGYQPLADGFAIGNTDNIPLVLAHVAYGQKPASEANTRTLWLTNRFNQVVPFVNSVGIPPFSRSFRIQRTVMGTSTLSITIEDRFGLTMNGPIIVPAGTDCPSINLSGTARIVNVTNLGPGGNVMSAVFNVQL